VTVLICCLLEYFLGAGSLMVCMLFGAYVWYDIHHWYLDTLCVVLNIYIYIGVHEIRTCQPM